MILDQPIAAQFEGVNLQVSSTDPMRSIDFADTGNRRIRTAEVVFITADLDGKVMASEKEITIGGLDYYVDSVSPSVDGFSQAIAVRSKT
jgi:hypothetical protein